MGHFCLRCGAPLAPRVIEGREVEACGNDDFVLWSDPKVATAVVVETDAGIVLGRRAIEPGYGEWCLPGGFVNHDEHRADAAVRECREEIGALVELDRLLGVYHVSKTTAASIVGVAYAGTPAAGETISVGSEMLEVGVFSLDALPPLAFPSHREVLELYARQRPASASPPSRARAGPTRSHKR